MVVMTANDKFEGGGEMKGKIGRMNMITGNIGTTLEKEEAVDKQA